MEKITVNEEMQLLKDFADGIVKNIPQKTEDEKLSLYYLMLDTYKFHQFNFIIEQCKIKGYDFEWNIHVIEMKRKEKKI